MEVVTTHESDLCIIAITGELDASSSIELDKKLQIAIENQFKKILFDCSKLQYISSPGIGVFTSRIDDFDKKGINVALYGVSDKILNVFRILGLHQVIPVAATKEEAKSKVNA